MYCNLSATALRLKNSCNQYTMQPLCDQKLHFSVADQSATGRQSVGDQLGSDRQPIGDQSATGWGLYLERLFLIADFWRSVGNWSAINRGLKTVSGLSATAATGRRSVANQSVTCRRPPKTFLWLIWSQRGFTCSNQNLLATKSSLQPVGDQSPTSLQPPWNLPETTRNFGGKKVTDQLQTMLKPRSHMYCNLSGTALRLKNSCNQCNHCAIKTAFFRLQTNRQLVGDNYP